jgi:hypothetical protein
MGALLRNDRWRYSLLIALAIAGFEIDVVSNPFNSEFLLCRLFSVLDEISAGPGCPRDVAEPAGAASAAITFGLKSNLTTDETAAILPRKPAKYLADGSCSVHAHVRPSASPPLMAIARADSPAHSFPPLGVLRTQLCRFLC